MALPHYTGREPHGGWGRTVPRLVLINGAPGTGKSTLARLYAERHPLTLALDLDVLRSMLGGWAEWSTEAGLLTREMAIEAARVHLRAGHDVLVPQLLGRMDFVLRLEQLATEAGAAFVEIVLVADAAQLEKRLAESGMEHRLNAARQPDTYERLARVVEQRAATLAIQSREGELEEMYNALCAGLRHASTSA